MSDWPIQETRVPWRAKVWIKTGGTMVPYDAVAAPTARFGFDQERLQCSVQLMRRLDTVGGEPAFVDIWANGVRRRLATGFLDPVRHSLPPLTYQYNIVDILWRLRPKIGTTVVWSNISFVAAVRDLLNRAGVTDSDIGDIYDPGSAYTVAPVQAVTLANDEHFSAVMQQLMDYAGTHIWVGPGGSVRVSEKLPIPSASATRTYSWKPTGSEIGMQYSGDVMDESFEAVISSFRATGPELSDGTTPNGTYTLVGVEGEHTGDTFRFAQTNAVCSAIAEREVRRRARDDRYIEAETMLEPDVLPGTNVLFSMPLIGYDTDTPAKVLAVAMSAPDMRVKLSLGPSLRAGGPGWDENGYPDAGLYPEFAMTIDAEIVLVDGNLVKRLFVHLDASASSGDNPITSYAWSFGGATSTPASPTGQTVMVYLDTGSPAGVTCTLTIGDGTGTVSTTKALDAAGQEVLTRILTKADGANGHAVIINADTGWERETRAGQECTAVPTFNPQTSPDSALILYAGWDDGVVRAYERDVAAATAAWSTVWTEPGGVGIDTIFVNEGDINHILIIAGTNLYQSRDGLATATIIRSGAAMQDVQGDPGGGDYILLLEGANAIESYDGGTTWATLVTGASGSTAVQLATAPWGRAVCYSSAGAAADVVKFTTGETVDWTAVTSPPTSLVTITPLLSDEAFVCADATGNYYRLDKNGATYDASDLGATTDGSNPLDSIRDGDMGNEMAYYAVGDTYTGKLLNYDPANQMYRVDDRASDQIGYGVIGLWPRQDVTPPGEAAPKIIVLPYGRTADDAGDKTHIYDTDTASWTAYDLPAGMQGMYWLWLAASPVNSNKLIAVGTSDGGSLNRYELTESGGKLYMADGTTLAIWRSDDGGQTWYAVDFALLSGWSGLSGWGSNIWTSPPVWHPTDPNRWAILAIDHLQQTDPRTRVTIVQESGPQNWSVQDWCEGLQAYPNATRGNFICWVSGANLMISGYGDGSDKGSAIGYGPQSGNTSIIVLEGTGSGGWRFVAPVQMDSWVNIGGRPGVAGVRYDLQFIGGNKATFGYAPDYTANAIHTPGGDAAPTSQVGQFCAAAADGTAYTTAGGGAGNVYRVSNLDDTEPTLTPVVSGERSYIRSDRQSLSVLVVRQPEQPGIHKIDWSEDGTVWNEINLPYADLSETAIEVVT